MAETLEITINGDTTELPLPGESSVAAAAIAAAAAAADSASAASDNAGDTAADRIQTGLDRVATGQDRTATGLDRTATGQDSAATAADRVQTGLDRVQTGADRASATTSAATAEAARIAVQTAVTGASIGSPVIPLIGTADFHACLTFGRSSTATLQQPYAAPTTLTEFASGAPRWDAQFGLRLEGAMPALDANPRFEGTVAGTPGTVPSGVTLTNSGSFAGRGIVGIGTENGYPYIDIQHVFASVSANGVFLEYGSVSVTPGLPYSGALACRLIAGTAPLMNAVMFDGTAAGSAASFTPSASYQFITPPALTATGASPVMRTRVRNTTAATSGTFTLRWVFFNIVQSSIRSSQIYPPPGTPGATTRARDTLSGALSGLSLATPGLTIIGRGMVPFTPGSGLSATILQLDNNAAEADAIRLATVAGSNSIVGTGLTTAGGTVTTASLGSLTPGAEFGWGLSVNLLTGGGVFNALGGTSQVLPDGSLPLRSLVTHGRFGGRIAAGSGLNGFMRRTTGRPFMVSASDLAALVAAA